MTAAPPPRSPSSVGDALRVAILSVGDELLAGDILDTNMHGLANELAARGHRLVGTACVGDDLDAIVSALRRAAEDADVLLVTGGLGPTRDDLTRDGVAAAFGLALEERADYLAQAQGSNAVLTEGARLQATFPAGATVLENARGTAPGFLVEGAVDGRALRVACFPGVPSELRPMARALLDGLGPGARAATRKLRCCGATESEVGAVLAGVMDRARAGCLVGVTASKGILTVSVRGDDARAVDATLEEARALLGDTVFGEGDDTHPAAVVRLLAERGLVVTTAESCTGGLVAGAITSVPGSSEVLREAVVTYSNEAKTARLGVPEALLAEHGAVSEPVAAAMAEGARARSGADVALSVSGIAGPGGGTPDKPVGTVVFGLADAAGTVTRTFRWRGGRDELRTRSVTVSLELLRRRLLGAARDRLP